MPSNCCVLQCRSSRRRNNIKFFRLPAVLHFRHKSDLNKLSAERRLRWLDAIKRAGFSNLIQKNAAVCEKHFILGRPAALLDKDDPDWVPSLHMGYDTKDLPQPPHVSSNTVIEVKQENLRATSSSNSNTEIDNNEFNCFKESPKSPMADEHDTKQNIIFQIEDNILQADDSNHICRLCLECNSGMFEFHSILTFDDNTTLDVSKTFQELTKESDDLITDSRLPDHICKTCLDLLVHSYNFLEKYKKTHPILEKMLRCEIKQEPEFVVTEVRNQELVENETPPKESSEEVLEDNQDEIEDETKDFLSETGDFEGTDSYVSDEDASQEPPEKPAIMHKCPICFELFTALDLKEHCRSHESLKSYLSLAPVFNKKVKFYATPKPDKVSIFKREDVTFSCPFCFEELEVEEFMPHMKDHDASGNYRCHLCNRMFIGRNHLKRHQLSHKKEAPFKCGQCLKPFFEKRSYDYHLLNHTEPDNLPTCKYCGKPFANPKHLRQHLATHEGRPAPWNQPSKYYCCKECRQKFKLQEDYDMHVCKFFCKGCKKLFESKIEFRKHFCKFKREGMQCDPCGSTFSLRSSQMSHKSRCTSKYVPRNVLCYVCGKTVGNLRLHLTSHGLHQELRRTCEHCGKMFACQANLRRHLNEVHLKLRTYCCQYCSKQFHARSTLTLHERTHVGVKNHACNVCGKRFLLPCHLKKHMKVHTRQNMRFDEDGVEEEMVEESSNSASMSIYDED
ncbi:uncharacterized protein [Euwallacea similis]|uniref:uncharacterized protein isoform X3 n=1 Tax=Euwallacea similis TaxID=1736056 RepID=UPI00344E0C17